MTLPIPGSLAAELFTLSEAEFRRRYGAPIQSPPKPVPAMSLDRFADRVCGQALWLLPGEGMVVGARFPPFATRPDTLTIAYGWVAGSGDPLDRAAGIGLPQPQVDPAYVLGESGFGDVLMGRSLKYIPAPVDLAELSYIAFKESDDKVHVTVVAVMLDEPQRSQVVADWQNALPWIGTGTMYFKDAAEVQSRVGKLYPPGAREMRRLLVDQERSQ